MEELTEIRGRHKYEVDRTMIQSKLTHKKKILDVEKDD